MISIARQSIAGSFSIVLHGAFLGAALVALNQRSQVSLQPYRVELSEGGGSRPSRSVRKAPAENRLQGVARSGDQFDGEQLANTSDVGRGSGGLESGDSQAVLVGNQKPPYPGISRRLGEEGEVLLALRVLPDGSAQDVTLKKSSGHERLDQAALVFAQGARYAPARMEMPMELKIKFSLD